MTAAKTRKTKSKILKIDGEMNIYRAEELKQTLLTALQHPGRMEIDLSGVSEIDTVGVQLMMLAKKTAQARQSELGLIHHSPAVLDIFELLNLVSYFGDQTVIAPSVKQQKPKEHHES